MNNLSLPQCAKTSIRKQAILEEVFFQCGFYAAILFHTSGLILSLSKHRNVEAKKEKACSEC